jgi:hypothetical protein
LPFIGLQDNAGRSLPRPSDAVCTSDDNGAKVPPPPRKEISMRRVFLLLLVGIAAFSSSLTGQSKDGQIQGVVRDLARNTIPGVEISLINTETKAILRKITNEKGEFRFDAAPGYYEIVARLPGFLLARVPEVQVKSGETLQLKPIEMTVDVVRIKPLPPPEETTPRWIPLERL